MSSMPADVQANPDNWEAAFKIVKSKHIDDEVEERVRAKLDSERRSAVENSSTASSPAAAKKELSDAERKVASGLGLKPEEYLAMQSQLQPVGKRGEMRAELNEQ